MENPNKIEGIDLGSDPVNEDFDPFAGLEDASSQPAGTTEAAQEPVRVETPNEPESVTPVSKAGQRKEPEAFWEKPPVFVYAGATESIADTSQTFDELRIEKSSDFPELEDGKRVSWTVEYGKITRTVADPKGTSIGKMKADMEASKEFEAALKKRGADKNPTCKVKPRVTAQSKGQRDVASNDTCGCGTRGFASYKAVFTNMEEADNSGKVISIVPGKDGKVYEIRNNVMGKFITPITDCEMLSDVRAGFIPALPLIPMDLMMRIVAFFRYFMARRNGYEALVNIYWDRKNREFIVDVPEQTVSKVSVESIGNPAFSESRYVHYMDIHSHNSMKAFFSSVDNSDEKATRLYTVIGNLHDYFPVVKTRISNGGKFHEIDPGEVFEYVAGPFPDDWKTKVKSYEICP